MNVWKFRTLAWPLVLVSLVGCDRLPDSSLTSEPLSQERPTGADVDARSPVILFSGDHGTPCKPAKKTERGTCNEGYFCVANVENPLSGSCRKDCGEKRDGKLVARTDACSSPFQCMLLRRADRLPLGMFCEKPQEHKNLPCVAAFSKDACRNGLTCLPTQYVNGLSKNLRCKQECNQDQPCNNGEECLFPSYARNELQKPTGRVLKVMCSITACAKNDPSCACDQARGFSCKMIMEGLDEGTCVRPLGVCGTSVSMSAYGDFRKTTYVGPTCNEITDSRVCSFSQKNPDAIVPRCLVINRTGEGVCYAPCSRPTFDLNRDGIIDDNEKGPSLLCPDAHACRTDVARTLDMMSMALTHDGKRIPCDPKNCEATRPCPKECGAGDGECVFYQDELETGYFCGAPQGLCEPN